jgi:hypothetical protein
MANRLLPLKSHENFESIALAGLLSLESYFSKMAGFLRALPVDNMSVLEPSR